MQKDKLISKVVEYNPHADVALIEKAFDFALQAHKGQKRESGEDYFLHVYEVTMTLISLHMDSSSIAAALLHDVLEDTKVKNVYLEELFGKEVTNLVESVTKIHKLDFESKTEESKAETVRKVLLATAKDIRVIMIKLADRLHNMQTLKYLPEKKRKDISAETLFIYAPIAHKLGIYSIKTELEDLALRHLEPEWYAKIKNYVDEKKELRENRLNALICVVAEKLSLAGINATIHGRAKTFYSIYRKIKIRGHSFEDIYDLLAIRVITKNVEECYKVLGIVHSTWKYMPKKFADYIANPKPNGYQSIHTKIIYNGQPAEIQIRSMEMHKEAEEGFAAHWRYKGTDRDKKFDRKLIWLKQILEWKATSDAKEFIEDLKVDLFKDEIIVFTPKGEPISLPEGATPIDFAYEIHSGIGDKCSKAKVNGRIVPLDSALSSGDLIEILTTNNASPSRQWLRFVKTHQARSKIRSALGIPGEEHHKTDFVESNVDFATMIIAEQINKPQFKFSRCCLITLNKPIVGFRTKDGKISLHLSNCQNMDVMDKHRRVEVKWKNFKKVLKTTTFNIITKDRIGLAAEILNEVSKNDVNIRTINSKTKQDKVLITLVLEISDVVLAKHLSDQIRYIPSVLDVHMS